MNIDAAQSHEVYAVLELVEELLIEVVEGGQELPWISREKLHADIRRNLEGGSGSRGAPGRLVAILAKENNGVAVGVLLLTQCFAVYAGGEYGVIDELYVRPEYRGRDIERELVDEAVAISQRRGWVRLDVTGPEAGRDGGRGERAAKFGQALGL
jgi:ribosomal protein S18 acetylase RimI-like enzyme